MGQPIMLTMQRLVLRHFWPEDTPRVRELAGAWDVARMTDVIPHPYPEGAAEQWIAVHDQCRAEGSGYPFAITRDDQCIGAIEVSADVNRGASGNTLVLGYWLGLPYWGQGLASEAVGAVVAFAFGPLGKTHLITEYFADNPASGRILAKTGFTEVIRGTMHSLARGCEVPSISLALTRDVWAARQV